MADNSLRFNYLVGRNEVPAASEKNARAMDRLASKTSGFGKIAAVALGGAAVAAGGMAAAGVVMGVKTAASLEQAQIGFTTLLGSSRKAGDYLTKLKAFAAATPFELPGLIESSRTLLGVGVSAGDSMKILKAFGDASAAVGVGQEGFQRIMIATSQAIGAGKFQTADLNQITNNGIPIWTILSRAMGKPIPVLRDLASHGKLLASDVLPVLEKQMGKDYGGAMARQSQTLSGLWSTLMDALNLGLASVIQPLMPALRTLATKGIGFLGAAFQKLPGIITTAMSGLDVARKWIETNVVPRIRTAIGTIRDHLPKIDLGQLFGDAKGIATRVAVVLAPVGGSVLRAAQEWGGRILTGVQTGLSQGNWGPLGKTLGDGLVTALTGLASQGKRLVGAFSSWFASVDWLAIGKTVGAQAIPFAIGFVNSLFDGLFTVARKHPMDLALFALAFIPLGKLAAAFGPLRSAIEHLPMGSWFTSLLDHTAVPVFDAVKKFLGFVFGGFLDGFRSWFPGLAKRFSGFWRGLGDEIGLRALYAWDAAKNFVYGIAHSIGVATGGVVRAIGTLIADMVRPFAKAGGWLIGKGIDFVGGLLRGLGSMFGAIGRYALIGIRYLTSPFRAAGGWLVDRGSQAIGGLISGVRAMFGRLGGIIGSTISRVTSPFRRAGSWLWNAGFNVLWGFLSGLKAMWGKVTGWVSGIASWIAQHKGPVSLDARLLVPAGMAIMTGFLKGLQSGAGRAWDFVKSVGGKTVAALQSALNFGGNPGVVKGFGSGVSRWAGIVRSALMAEGLSPTLMPRVLSQMQTESGGNPNAINLWDINAKNGTPSKGLMQVIDPTFRAYHWPGTSWNIYDPVANIYAALNYARHRYGSGLGFLGHGHGYDEGGVLRPGVSLAVNKTGRPERILSTAQTVAFERLVDVLARPQYATASGGAGTTVINVALNAPNYIGTRSELLGTLEQAARTGQLDRIVKLARG